MISRHTSRSIDVIRGTAALGVIWGHSIYGFSLPLDLNGAFWVWIFLVVSGYLVGKSFLPEAYGLSVDGYRRFLWNRVLRIMPLAYVGLLAGVVIERSAGAEATPWHDVFRQLTFSSHMNAMSLASPLWTVATEVQFYVVSILLAVFVLGSRRWWLGWLVWGGSILVAYHGIRWLGDNPSQPRTLIGNLPFFVLGLVLADDRYNAALKSKRVVKLLLVLIPVGIAWYLNNLHPDYFWGWGRHHAVPMGGGALCAMVIAVVVLCCEPSEPRENWVDRSRLSAVIGALGWCGFYTYGIYVYHSVIAKLNATVFGIPPGPVLLALLLTTLVLAPLSYRLIEAPLLRFKSRKRGTPGPRGMVQRASRADIPLSR